MVEQLSWNGVACNKYICIQVKIDPYRVLKIFIYSLFSTWCIVAIRVTVVLLVDTVSRANGLSPFRVHLNT